MPLDRPSLDTRSFDQLVTESRRTVPLLAPKWTDHNASDPGITLTELVAGLVEQDLYRLDRVPDRQMRAYLRLVGIEQRPAGVATGIVALASAVPQPHLPRGLQIAAETVLVETSRPVAITAAAIASIVGGGQDLTAALQAADRDSFPLGREPKAGDALTIAFDAPLGEPDVPISIAIWRRDPEADATIWAAVIAEWQGARRDARLLGRRGCAERPLRAHDDVEVAWEYLDVGGDWQPLPNARDTTRGFSLSGWLRFAVPADHAPDADGRYPIRARLVSGTYSCAPTIRGLRLNAVAVRHAARIQQPEQMGRSHGRAGERFVTAQTPVVAGSTRITWHDGTTAHTDWREAPTWDLVGSNDRRFVLEREALTFGNGRQGRVPGAGWMLTAEYDVGGGLAGNLAAGALQSMPPTERNTLLAPTLSVDGLAIEQPFALFGGREAETLTEAKARAIDRVQRTARAVTVADYEELALRVPGIEVARARALSRHHPLLPAVTASGCITVIVVPRCQGRRPTPQPGFLAAVAAWLDRRRLVTADVRVVAPCYTEVAVSARLHLSRRADAPLAEARAQAALASFLDPLHGGPDGQGWPIGRPVYRSEIMALLANLPMVEAVTDLGLSGEGEEMPGCDNFELCADCLPVSGNHQITIDAVPALRAATRSDRHDRC